MSRWIAAGFVVLGVLHTPPAVGALSSEALSTLYGPAAGDDSVAIVLRHRGAMFALVALACYTAAAVRRWRPFVMALVAWSMLSFLILYLAAGVPSGPLFRIALADGIGVAVLTPMALALRRRPSSPAASSSIRSGGPALVSSGAGPSCPGLDVLFAVAISDHHATSGHLARSAQCGPKHSGARITPELDRSPIGKD